jgi:predicted  nucleic acid-binding Zn-ribbon protein
MANQAGLLYRLQSVDLEIARNRARLKEIDVILNNDETISLATQQLESAEKSLKPWQTRARELELEIKSVVEKSTSADADLYSGRITNPKALQEIQSEIEALRRRQGQLEDELLEAMLEVEGHQAEVAAASESLSAARATLASTQSDLLTEQQRLNAETAQSEERRKAMAAGIEPANLASYDKLRQRMRGQAVALLQNDGCSLCGVEQTMSNLQAVRSGRALVYCESCGRILANTV